MRRLITAAVALLTVGGVGVTAGASVAGAAKPVQLFVSNTSPLSNDTSCSAPGYATVQAAVDAAPAGAVVDICAGTYTEQVTVTTSLSLVAQGAVTLALPAVPTPSTSACDTALTGAYPYGTDIDELDVCGAANVTVTGLTVDALLSTPADCSLNLYGVLVAGGAHLTATNVTVDGAGELPTNGCQTGVGIEIGSSTTTPVQVGVAHLTGVTVSGYQKNGITADGTGSSAVIKGSFVTGAGQSPVIAQNGIQISDGALGSITTSTVSANECSLVPTAVPYSGCGPDPLEQYQASGVLFYGAAVGSSLTSSSITGNDVGVYFYSAAATQATSPEATVKSVTLTNNRYAGFQLDQGDVLVTKDDILGSGNVGIQVLQYDGQTYSSDASATKVVISGQGVGVQVLSDDAPTGDLAGNFIISHSTFRTTNAVAEQDNSTDYTIGGVADH